MTRSARRPLPSLVVILAVGLATMVSGCAPGTPDGDSWRIDAQRAVSDAASAVHTAELALRLHDEGRVYGRYLQTVLVDAEEAVGIAGDAIARKQPPQTERERYGVVTGQIDEATSLVATTRIAVVDRESERYDALADRLAEAATALTELEADLQHPPAPAVSG
ncbi:hypothetical protein [Nocardioides dilutus]